RRTLKVHSEVRVHLAPLACERAAVHPHLVEGVPPLQPVHRAGGVPPLPAVRGTGGRGGAQRVDGGLDDRGRLLGGGADVEDLGAAVAVAAGDAGRAVAFGGEVDGPRVAVVADLGGGADVGGLPGGGVGGGGEDGGVGVVHEVPP